MIHIAETVTVGSVEGFLDADERARLATVMSGFLADKGPAHFDTGRTTSIHEIPGHSTEQAMAVYEPAGRVEVRQIPGEAEELLQHAFDRARPALSRVMPSITTCRPWTYVEYGPGQHITGHLDGIAPDPLAWPRQIAGISVVISEAEAGGAFYVESCSSDRLWSARLEGGKDGYADGMWLAHDGADHSADWFTAMPRTRWNVSPAPGAALLYGSQLTHGTEPVTGGRVSKFISWLIAEKPEE
ncbi:hypothetical protein F9278_27615 [Streptomyces phaeolivaceus]|uniref:Fe2OG dioxygenase domain-containing protein n=1 Tax=Streptomyces phaeolivaceus TaxID=2653200 RepID=A0A5P8K9T8_9ACTN|nr:hypothetical protein [Streptomyces phaeolivaceus]QFQ99289.1 hypothetical protein F9278_27615 [Streptomyces phaeolivaceus]